MADEEMTHATGVSATARYEQLITAQSRLEGKLDAFITAHDTRHTSEQSAFQQHLINSAVMGERGQNIDREVKSLRSDVDQFIIWKAEVAGMTNLLRFTVGTSLIGLLLAGLNFINQISGGQLP
jgi:hypothetical protein